jgi:uncharacterized RDD family membrane protein YckC
MSDPLPPPPGDAFPPPGGQLPPPPPPPGQAGFGYGYQQQGYGYSYGPGYRYAGFWIRFAASLLDGLILGVPVAILGAAFGSSGFAFGPGYNPGAQAVLNILNTVVGVLYYGLLEGGPTGQTLGKRICGIKVIDADTGAPIGYGRGIGRYFARILSGLALGLGYLWMLWDPRKQTWHDKLVRSVVVRSA